MPLVVCAFEGCEARATERASWPNAPIRWCLEHKAALASTRASKRAASPEALKARAEAASLTPQARVTAIVKLARDLPAGTPLKVADVGKALRVSDRTVHRTIAAAVERSDLQRVTGGWLPVTVEQAT